MGKWDDDIPLQPRGAAQPSSVAALLRALKLTDASKPAQLAGMREWLKTHTPSPGMEHSLRRKGYARLLDERTSA
ncbi:hypothetical protein C1Y40_04026 [Mycobacterium talmoniae]|uniref:Uncharacterized protein n=1 Tax=Mycobacterium talmoniae TaxID=1858794 RepID=A0A2S8BGS1_9MYCO|nr:hypothetical protein C1Y40_04026 [Mycobacterium talmoniae]